MRCIMAYTRVVSKMITKECSNIDDQLNSRFPLKFKVLKRNCFFINFSAVKFNFLIFSHTDIFPFMPNKNQSRCHGFALIFVRMHCIMSYTRAISKTITKGYSMINHRFP